MVGYIYYNKNTGDIHSKHQFDSRLDTLTAKRQTEMLKLMFGQSAVFHDMAILVNEGDSAVFFPDVLKVVGGREIVDVTKLNR